jgi:hypothetical protein
MEELSDLISVNHEEVVEAEEAVVEEAVASEEVVIEEEEAVASDQTESFGRCGVLV